MLNHTNIFGLLAFITIIVTLTSQIKSNELTKLEVASINQYLYYFPQKEIVLCSDKLYSESEINIIPNELKLKENEFTCMINLDKTRGEYIKINLNIMKPNSNNFDKNSIDIFLGDSPMFKNLIFFGGKEDNNEAENYYSKTIIVRIKDNKVYFLKNINCDLDNEIDCHFEAAKESLFKGNHLMLNLKLHESHKDISFIEKKANSKSF